MKNFTKLAGLGLGVLLLASSALPASASSLTAAQISAIIGLLQSFGADQSVIANVYVTLGAQIPPPTGGYSPTNCPSLFRNLTVGLQGDDVTSLQDYLMTLGDLASGNNTGYFGSLTQQAVMQWQTAHGISAVGAVGPQTRAAMGCNQSGTSVAPTQTSGTPTATIDQSSLNSTSGIPTITGMFENTSDIAVYISPQPLAATNPDFSKVIWAGNTELAGGISTSGNRYSAPLISSGVWPAVPGGTYYVGVYNDCNNSGCPNNVLLASGTLTVAITDASATNSVNFTATPIAGAAPLLVRFTMTGADIAFNSFDFGDGTSFSVGTPGSYNNVSCTAAGPDSVCSGTHTYVSPGVYIAKLKDVSGTLLDSAGINVTSATY